MSPDRSRFRPAGARAFGFTRCILVPGALLAGALSGCRIEVEEDETGSLPEYVHGMLEASASAWNRGDLDRFMEHYVRSASTTYLGEGGLLTGYEAIRDHYAPRFASGADRDSLRFEDVRARWLGGIDGLVTARWVLYDAAGTIASGPFTLVLRRTGTGWKIVHDHSSSDPSPAAPEN